MKGAAQAYDAINGSTGTPASAAVAVPTTAPTTPPYQPKGRKRCDEPSSHCAHVPAPTRMQAPTHVFWYACGHCYAIEPKVEAWIKKGKPAYVDYVFIPATWNDMLKTHARVFYTIQLLGKPQLHDAVFREINVKRNMLDTPAKIEAFFVANGVSKADFQKAFSSFAVESKIRQAEDLNRRYKITGTPTFVVGGKYVTDVRSAGSEDALFEVLGALAAKDKSGR